MARDHRNQGDGNGNPWNLCSWCGKNNHPSDKCFFNPNNKNRDNEQQNHSRNQNQNREKRCNYSQRNGHIESECFQRYPFLKPDNPKKQKSQKRCDYCGKNGHFESECFQKNPDLRNNSSQNGLNNNNQNRLSMTVDVNSGQRYDVNQYCTLCTRSGHRDDICYSNNRGLMSGQSQTIGDTDTFTMRCVEGNTVGMGGAIDYEQPVWLVRRVSMKSSWYGGQEYLEDFMIDVDADVLMCSCPFPGSQWCIHKCASNLNSQSGNGIDKMWVSEDDRAAIELGMNSNWVPSYSYPDIVGDL